MQDIRFKENLMRQSSPCEGARLLGLRYERMNPLPGDGKKWILDQLKVRTESNTGKRLLSSAINDHEPLMGTEISIEKEKELEELSRIPLRFWTWSQPSDETKN